MPSATETVDRPRASAIAGLDSLQVPHSESRRDSLAARILPPLSVIVLFFSVWQIYVVLTGQRVDVLPGPIDVMRSAAEAADSGRLPGAVATSVGRGLIGFAASAVIATPIGLLVANVAGVRRAVGPLISAMQVLPSVAWVPAAIIWFGLSNATIFFVLFAGAIPSIINGLVAGIDQVPPQYRRVGTVLGATRMQVATRIVLPAALPGYVAGLKQGWAFSWRSLMAAEIIAIGGSMGFGLGSMLQLGRELSDMGLVLVSILAILLVGIAIELLAFAPIERRILARRGLNGAR